MSIEFNAGLQVSIHASVKDATGCGRERDTGPRVSIHASVKDATQHAIQEARLNRFQSTHL